MTTASDTSDWHSYRWTVLCAAVCGVLTASCWLPPGVKLVYTPDSFEYTEMAVNLRAGRGYTLDSGSRVAVNRSPVYPVVLAVLWDPRVPVWHKRVIWFQRCLAFVVGFSVLLYANAVFGRPGMLCGVLTTFLICADEELQTAGSQVLTELPATALMTMSLLAAQATHRGPARRELLMAVIQIGIFMTRSALVFCGVGYGVRLLYRAYVDRSADSRRRVLWFAVPCTLAVAGWSGFLWSQTGRFVLLTSTGTSNMAAGLSPETIAAARKLPMPRTEAELEKFWASAPEVPSEVVWTAFRAAARDPGRMLYLTAMKIKFLFRRAHPGMFCLAVCGIAAQLFTHRSISAAPSELNGQFSRLRSWISRCGYFAAFGACTLAVCGFSLPVTGVVAVLATIVVIGCQVAPSGQPFGDRFAAPSIPGTLLMVYGGLVLMTLTAFGIPRFLRPFLPAFYLSATLCIPLACRLLLRSSVPPLRDDV